MIHKKLLLLSFGLLMTTQMIYSQNQIKRDPDSRKDYVNVFYKSQYTLFDLWSDEPIFPDNNGIYHIYYATNEDKTPKELNGKANQLMSYSVYKFKNYENCKKWCDGVVYKNTTSKYSISSSSTNQTKNSEIKKETEDPSSNAIRMTAQANAGKSIEKAPEKYGCIDGDCVNGFGVYKFHNGSTYAGDFVNGIANGWGTLKSSKIFKKGFFKDGNYVENDSKTNSIDSKPKDGCISGDCENGFGVRRYFNGDVYTGNFVSGIRSGYGEYNYASGRDEQKGYWENGDFTVESASKNTNTGFKSTSQNNKVVANKKSNSKPSNSKKISPPEGLSTRDLGKWMDSDEGQIYLQQSGILNGLGNEILNQATSSSSSSSSSSTIKDKRNVFICTAQSYQSCCKLATSTTFGYPKTGCCARTDGKGCSSGHSWSDVGEEGETQYVCNYCSISVKLKSYPTNGGCCSGSGGCMGHSWTKVR
jgi:hypothetical protein